MRAAAAAVLVLALLVACGSGSNLDDPSRAPRTVTVPGDVDTIQGAMEVAVPGDLILISPGVYEEPVSVKAPRIVIRGLSRSDVIVEGRKAGGVGIDVRADGVAIENLTVRNFGLDGLRFRGTTVSTTTGSTVAPLVGYRASYLTVSGNGRDGVRIDGARRGVVEHVHVSGNRGAGIGLRQCKPCNAVVRDSTAEYDGVGFDATDAGGDVLVMTSTFRRNGMGMRAASVAGLLAPQAAATFAGNLVQASGDSAAPAVTGPGFGTGIVVAGGTFNRIERNRVVDNPVGGIVVTDLGSFVPRTNRVSGNVLEGNDTDLIYGWQRRTAEGARNCFADNTFTSSKPTGIEVVMPCGRSASPRGLARVSFPAPPAGPDEGTAPLPPNDLPEMPEPKDAPPRAANVPVAPIAVERIPVPPAT